MMTQRGGCNNGRMTAALLWMCAAHAVLVACSIVPVDHATSSYSSVARNKASSSTDPDPALVSLLRTYINFGHGNCSQWVSIFTPEGSECDPEIPGSGKMQCSTGPAALEAYCKAAGPSIAWASPRSYSIFDLSGGESLLLVKYLAAFTGAADVSGKAYCLIHRDTHGKFIQTHNLYHAPGGGPLPPPFDPTRYASMENGNCAAWVKLFTPDGTAIAPGAPPATGTAALLQHCTEYLATYNNDESFSVGYEYVALSEPPLLISEWWEVGQLKSGAYDHTPKFSVMSFNSNLTLITKARDFPPTTFV